MPKPFLMFYSAILFMLLAGSGYALAEEFKRGELTLSEAIKLALQVDPLIARSQSRETALKENAGAAYAWPDPKLKLGMMNVPTSGFSFQKEPMTQIVVGVVQAIPPFGMVGAKRDKLNEMSEAAAQSAKDQELKTIRGVRYSWFNVYYQYHAKQLVAESRKIFSQFIRIARSQYKTGRGKQQDVVRAQLEESMLSDREKSIESQWDVARAELYKWIGRDAAGRELDMITLPELPRVPREQQLTAAMVSHPAIEAGKSRVRASENGVKLANTRFRPGLALDLSYGHRGSDLEGNTRSDFISAMLMVDLPIFPGRKQSKALRASEAELLASKNTLDDLRRIYQEKLDSALASYQRLNERLEIYRSLLLPQAEQNTEATMNAYQSGVTEFNDLVRARLTELDSHLNFLKLQVAQAKVHTDLLYISGE